MPSVFVIVPNFTCPQKEDGKNCHFMAAFSQGMVTAKKWKKDIEELYWDEVIVSVAEKIVKTRIREQQRCERKNIQLQIYLETP